MKRRRWSPPPLTHGDGKPLFTAGASEAELVVRLGGKEGRVRWPIPPSIR